MRQGVGSVFLYNIIIVFIVITFGFLSATLSYMKAFKVNSKVASVLEKYEGYNSLSKTGITNSLSTIGYRNNNQQSFTCPKKKGQNAVAITEYNYRYCLYEYDLGNGYFNYGIITYIYFDIPVISGTFKIPVYSESEKIYNFSR